MIKSRENNAHSVGTAYKSHLEYITSSNASSVEQMIDRTTSNDFNDEVCVKKSSRDKDLLKQSDTYEDSRMHNFPENLRSFLVECIARTDAKEFFCGWGASVINITITFPINKIIFRQMLHNVRVGGAFDQIRSEGFLFLYRGVLPPLMQKSISTSLMFGMYENCRKPMLAFNIPPIIGNPTAAMLAGTIEAVLTPFERIQTLMQDSGYHKHFKNTSHAMKVVLSEYGFKEFYRGLVPILLRNGPSNVFFFGLRDYYNEKIPDSKLWYLKITKQFMIGACIGSFISSIFYPCNVVKVHVQSQLGGRFIGFVAAAKEVFLERNKSIRGFYRGIYMNCTRSFVSWGVINVSYEAIHKIVYK